MSGTSSGGEAWTEIVCCPECRSALAEDAGGALLRCVACGRSFPVEDRIARILPARLTRSAQGTARCFSFEWRTLGDVLHSPTGADAALRSAGKLLEACGLSLEALAGRRVLDAGCGNGGYAAAFESLGAEVTGVDLSLDGLARA
ncbi:MAG: methyltransferase domain-containing protein, partial [Planctomycetes bacterium]|nr:methyltransferase domain-containing protein [Planctomycetota bacterium]